MADDVIWGPLVSHYERCFVRHGRTAQGVDWPNQRDLETRFDVMLEVAAGASRPVDLLDLGCGPGLLVDHLHRRERLDDFRYRGIDLSVPMIESARAAWPDLPFEIRDILADPLPPDSVDVVILNGVLTERRELPREAMARFAESLLAAAFRLARRGIAFNVMSRHVDWERDDLFHWGFDEVAAFARARLSRHLVIRADYGLHEFTTYVFRETRPGVTTGPA